MEGESGEVDGGGEGGVGWRDSDSEGEDGLAVEALADEDEAVPQGEGRRGGEDVDTCRSLLSPHAYWEGGRVRERGRERGGGGELG